jgi:choline-sulfatase
MKKRPNILFLMSDQHRFDFTGYEGHITRTPNLDWLAETGAHFTNAYTPSPVCVPARQCMASGQLPRTCQCETFTSDLPPDYMTFARRFSQYAYKTVCCGKLHHTGPDQMQGWSWRIGEELHVHPSHIEDRIEEEFKKYKPAPQSGTVLMHSLKASGTGFNPVQLVDDYTAQGALNAIKLLFDNPLSPPSGQPVLLKVSLIAPHDPFITCDKEKFDYYYDKVVLPPSRPPLPEWRIEGDWPELVEIGKDLPEETVRAAHAAYHAMIERVDELFGNVMQSLRDAGHDLDDWIIIYCSDHGELLGDHTQWWKFNFFEASVRVPLLIRAPKWFKGGIKINQNVNLCDLFATLCDMANIETPPGLDSRSLLPLLRGESVSWNNESISALTGKLMIKRDDLKYIFYEKTKQEILFNLAADPGETKNFIADPVYTKAVEAFRQRRGELSCGPDADAGY